MNVIEQNSPTNLFGWNCRTTNVSKHLEIAQISFKFRIQSKKRQNPALSRNSQVTFVEVVQRLQWQ
jgi:hypothetical protein